MTAKQVLWRKIPEHLRLSKKSGERWLFHTLLGVIYNEAKEARKNTERKQIRKESKGAFLH